MANARRLTGRFFTQPDRARRAGSDPNVGDLNPKQTSCLLEGNPSALVKELCLFCRHHNRTDAGQCLVRCTGSVVVVVQGLREGLVTTVTSEERSHEM